MKITYPSGRGKSDRSRLRPLAVAVVLMVVGASCGGGSADSESETSPSTTAETAEDQTASEDQTESTVNISAEIARVDLPPGLRLSDAGNQTATLDAVSYLVTATAEGMQLVAITDEGAAATSALIAGGKAAEVWNSGTRIVMTGLDAVGNLVVLTSSDGESFTEALIPIPAKYADADVWQATSLLGDALGVADLNGDILMIAALGINWPSDLEVVARHAYTISEEVGDAARFAGTIKQKPEADGDFLYTFEVDGEVVFESLGSDAGLEPGYREAFQTTLDTDTRTHGSWIISGSTATQTPDPPFDGGLDDDTRLKALYPVDNGAAAIVVDFSFEDPDGNENASAGETVLISSHTDDLSATLLWLFNPQGRAVLAGKSAVVPGREGQLPDKVVVDADVEGGSYQMLTILGGQLNVFDSDTGTEWESPPLTISITLPDGATIEIELPRRDNTTIEPESTGDRTFIMVWPSTTDGGVPRLFRSDGFIDDDGFLEEIVYETGKPKARQGDASTIESSESEEPSFTTQAGLNVWKMLIEAGDDTSLEATAAFIGIVLDEAAGD